MKTVGNGFHKTSKLVWRNKGVNRQPRSNPSPYFQFFEGCWWGPCSGTQWEQGRVLPSHHGLLKPPSLGCVNVGVIAALHYYFFSLKLWQNPAKDMEMIRLVT